MENNIINLECMVSNLAKELEEQKNLVSSLECEVKVLKSKLATKADIKGLECKISSVVTK